MALFVESNKGVKLQTWFLFILTVVTILWALGSPVQHAIEKGKATGPGVDLSTMMLSGVKETTDPVDSAISALKEMLLMHSSDPQKFIEDLKLLKESGVPEGAAELAERIPDTVPLMVRALKAAAKGQFETARSFAIQEGKHDQKLSWLLIFANKAFEEGDYPKSIDLFTEAITLKPDNNTFVNKLVLSIYRCVQAGGCKGSFDETAKVYHDFMAHRAVVMGAFAYNLGTMEFFNREIEQAAALYWLALVIFQQNLGINDVYTQQTYQVLKALYSGEGDQLNYSKLVMWNDAKMKEAEEDRLKLRF